MFNWDEFKNKKVAVNCDTEEKAREFIKECYKRGLKWSVPTEKHTMFDWYKKDTCYEYEIDENRLMFADKKFYKSNGYKIIKWESENMKFKIGDKVRAIDDRYSVTNKKNGFIGEVIELIDETLIAEHVDLAVKELGSQITWKVNSRHFELIERQTEFTFKEVIARNIPGVYVNCNDDMARVQSIEIHEDGDFSINAEFKGLKEINLGLGINHNLKFKLQEPKKKYVLYGIEHQENGKIYFFRSKEDKVIPDTSFVICNTSKGKSYGRAVQRIEKELTESEYKQYKECWRA